MWAAIFPQKRNGACLPWLLFPSFFFGAYSYACYASYLQYGLAWCGLAQMLGRPHIHAWLAVQPAYMLGRPHIHAWLGVGLLISVVGLIYVAWTRVGGHVTVEVIW